ncbi:MAG: bifunctional 4-hydroxy-2-oxoglutarate aldolase/2-dehydro-3-deoxy-phosphogluconate aldolase [Clostridia bacterium]|nr:bifunctional 4-hydroxy-2-oxoglutarate aldolase/2-dehydro-3-deoxy-phosphogluconate aldolase [Clostridia bacterium]
MFNEVIKSIEKNKIIAIIRGVAKEQLIPLADALYKGGIRLIEVTYSANGKISDTETAERISILAKKFEGKMLVGAGTVLTKKQVALTKKAGGKFIISPDTNKIVIKKTKRLGLVSMPGALTPSEIEAAHRAGADFVKLFPVSSLGPEYVKAVSAPLSHIKLLAVGGVDLDNISSFLKAGVCGFGLGSNIVDKKLLEANDFEEITELAKKYVSEVM